MAKVTGSVDDRGRPVVRLDGKDDSILVTVDTGFNGDLMVTREAAKVLGVDVTEIKSKIELGDGTIARVHESPALLSWLGELRSTTVFVADTWTTSPDAPSGLLGTRLLSPHLLLVDFDGRTVEIETQG